MDLRGTDGIAPGGHPIWGQHGKLTSFHDLQMCVAGFTSEVRGCSSAEGTQWSARLVEDSSRCQLSWQHGIEPAA